MPRIRSDGGAVRSLPTGTPEQPIVRPSTRDKPPRPGSPRPPDPIPPETSSRSAKAETPDPGQYFSLADLARSWAEVTPEAWESILYRLGDWAITDAFPDEAFLTDVATGITFHKSIIFDRMRWHRDLVDKIRRVQDCKERNRLQKFAHAHIQAAEIALVRRDVVVEACRTMNVAPPPILGLVEGVSAEHPAPLECPLDSPVGVFAREAERDQELLRHRDVMPADKAEGYTLLWDAATEMSGANGCSLEWNWLRLMDAFWSGDLSPGGLVHFYRGRLRGGEYVVYAREELASLLLGLRPVEDGTRELAQPIETLRLWAVADYLAQPAPFGVYFWNDYESRFGLAVLTEELDYWRRSTVGAGKEVSSNQYQGTEAMPLGSASSAIAPGPKGREKKVDQRAWEIALQILNGDSRPPFGYGRLTSLARLVNAVLAKEGHQRQDDSIRKAIGPTLRAWEIDNPEL